MTQNDDNSFGRARERVRTALAAMGFGNPEPYIDCWAKSDDATLFGAWGPIERGLCAAHRDISLGRQPLQEWSVSAAGHRLLRER